MRSGRQQTVRIVPFGSAFAHPTAAPDRVFDGTKRTDPFQGLLDDGRSTDGMDIKELSSHMCPAIHLSDIASSKMALNPA